MMEDSHSVAFHEIEEKAKQVVRDRIKEFDMLEDIDKSVHMISDSLIQGLTDLSKNFKWIVNCMMLEEEGASLNSDTSFFWDRELDGYLNVEIRKEKYIVNVVVYCLAL